MASNRISRSTTNNSITRKSYQEAFNDLLAISQADGVILDSEWSFLDAVKGAWGVTAT